MKESPILMNTEMTKATYHHEKTETRRTDGLYTINGVPDEWIFNSLQLNKKGELRAFFSWVGGSSMQHGFKSRFGAVGDLLYVRETFFLNGDEYIYLADGTCCEQFEQCECFEVGKPKWRPSIHMPKEAASIWLKITEVRIERLQAITNDSAIEEGIQCIGEVLGTKQWKQYHPDINPGGWPVISFWSLWASIYGIASWDANPWVWVYKFEMIDKEGGKPS